MQQVDMFHSLVVIEENEEAAKHKFTSQINIIYRIEKIIRNR